MSTFQDINLDAAAATSLWSCTSECHAEQALGASNVSATVETTTESSLAYDHVFSEVGDDDNGELGEFLWDALASLDTTLFE